MREFSTYYLYVKGQRVAVSEEIYRAYVQPQRRLRMRDYRAQDKFSFTSIESLYEKGFEIEDETQHFETALIEGEEHSEELSKLHAAIERLSERDKRIVRLYYFEGKTQQEIATILGIAKSSMSELLKRILKRLKNFYIFFRENTNFEKFLY